MKRTGFIFLLFFVYLTIFPEQQIFAQLSSGGTPASSVFALPVDGLSRIIVAKPDLDAIRQEDEQFPSPYRFAVNIPVDISPENSGTWVNLPDGGRSWRIQVDVPGALATSAYFDAFRIPEGGKLFLYNPGKTQVIGAFTSANNSASGYFASELIAGDQMILEYDQPAGSQPLPIMHLYAINYAYRGVGFLDPYRNDLKSAGACEVNVNCPEGTAWQDEKKGVCRLMIKKLGGGVWCTGSLVNNVRIDHTPYVLTADHCFQGATAADIQQWIFYFNYEAQDCSGQVPGPGSKTMTGATLKAHGGDSGDTGSDFCLVLLNEGIPDTLDVFFNGWSRKDTTSPSGVCIHHPLWDIKKISTYDQPLISTNYSVNPNPCHWKVSWIETQSGHGVTERGSSGSPLFDNKGRVVGTLTGGESTCEPSHLNSPDYYGKFSWSWDRNGTDSSKRLKDWLDPDSTGVFSIDGLSMGVPHLSNNTSIKLFPNPFTDNVNIKFAGFNESTGKIDILNLMGIIVWSETINLAGFSTVSLSLPGLAHGLYFMRLTFPGSVSTLKMIRQ